MKILLEMMENGTMQIHLIIYQFVYLFVFSLFICPEIPVRVCSALYQLSV